MADYDYLDRKQDDGTILGQSTSSLIGFWGITPVDQPAALTTGATVITMSAYSAPGDYAIQVPVSTAGYGFAVVDESQAFLAVVKNIQIRISEVQSKLAEAGIIAGGTAVDDPKYDVVGKGGDDGSILGQAATDKIGFWGVTPCDQPAALTAQETTITASAHASPVYTITALTQTSGIYGFKDVEEALSLFACVANMQARITEVETNLAECGLIAGGTAAPTTSSYSYNYLDKGNDDGTILGQSSSTLVGFWGTTPVDQPATLTTALTTISCTAAATMDYAIAALATGTTGTGGFKFNALDQAQTVLSVIRNAQVRLAEIETRLEEVGLVAAN